MLKLAILDDFQGIALRLADWSPVRERCEITVFSTPFADEDDAAARLAQFDILCLMRERTAFPASLLARLPNLKMIVVTGAHNRTLDTAFAAERGIAVRYTGAASTERPTTELTWALILATARHITREEQGLRAGQWQTLLGRNLHGRTLGLVGLGRIGKTVAAVGQAFGMRTMAWSPNLTAERAAEAGVTAVSKADLFAEADVISLHLVLSPRTTGIVSADDIARMRPDAVLVNTSRSQLVDEDALFAALRDGRIGGAGLDVFSREPLPPDDRLLTLPNVVLTPHLGYATSDVYAAFYRASVEQVLAHLDGKPVAGEAH